MISREDRDVMIRHDRRPGDLGRLIELHGVLYAVEYGFDHTFEAYVAGTVAEYGRAAQPYRDRLWLAEVQGGLVGAIAIVGREDDVAQLRWFLVAPEARGRGLGGRLLQDAIAFCRERGYRSVFLWTVHPLTTAAHLYATAGFRKTEEKAASELWGATLVEECYSLAL